MLNNKAKIDFLKWLNELSIAPYVVMFDELPLNVRIMYIIEWLDSVGLIITTEYVLKWIDYKVHDLENYGSISSGNGYDTREECYVSAVERANKIYNYR